jgi:hypothetical protein
MRRGLTEVLRKVVPDECGLMAWVVGNSDVHIPGSDLSAFDYYMGMKQ